MNDKLTARLLAIAGKLAAADKKEIESEAGPKIARAGEPRIDVLRRIVKEGYEKIDGYTVDATTASMLITVYESLAKRGTDLSKFDRIPLRRLVDFGWSQVRSASVDGLKSRRAMYWGGPDRVYRLTRTEQENGNAVCPKCKKEMQKEPFTKSDKLYTCQSCGFKVPTSKTTTTRVTIDVDKDTGEVDVDVTTAKGRRGTGSTVAHELMAIEFPTQDAYDKYMKEHPDADKSLHRVTKTETKTEKKSKPLSREVFDQVADEMRSHLRGTDRFVTKETMHALINRGKRKLTEEQFGKVWDSMIDDEYLKKTDRGYRWNDEGVFTKKD
jgi:predicted RNA-binding Zn-ribbon protein involved in translation (DUF1610 family)